MAFRGPVHTLVTSTRPCIMWTDERSYGVDISLVEHCFICGQLHRAILTLRPQPFVAIMAPAWLPLDRNGHSAGDNASTTFKNVSADKKRGHTGRNGVSGRTVTPGNNGFVKNGTNEYRTGNGYVGGNGEMTTKINLADTGIV